LIIEDSNGTDGADQWQWIVNNTQIRGQVLTAAGANGENWVTVTANASSEITSIALAADTIDLDGAFRITERSAAVTDVAGAGQLWVKNTTPNQFWFTNDAGDDRQIPMIAAIQADPGGTPAGNPGDMFLYY
jgi:hypothetical protein